MKKLIIVIFSLILITGCNFFDTDVENKNEFFELANFINGEALVDSFTIYGRYFNLSGEVEKVSNLSLVLKSKTEEIEYDLILDDSSNKTKFRSSELINGGINLETINNGEYVFLLKSVNNGESKYYSLKNKTDYQDLTYYTITKDDINNKINISFENIDNNSFLYLSSLETSLPDDIYDIVIDPGHGGEDSGASKNGYFESHINLDYAKKIKSELEKIGLKVKLTRDEDKRVETYGEDGRVSIPYTTKAKLLLSVHMNLAINNVGKGGVEIYVPNKIDTTFATNLAKNIVGFTSSSYSTNVSNKIDSGVYLRTLSKSDLENIKEEADELGFIPYEKATLDSTYYYIIRETGGIITGAYVDSRNKEKEWNHFYDSNHGCESYLLELGYMNSSSNLNILLTEKDMYVKAIVESVKEYLEI